MDKQILKVDNELVYSGFKLLKNGIEPVGVPTFEQWQEAGEFIKKASGSVHMWLGDWLNYGEQRYGEMYSQAIDETGYDYSTLRNDKWIAYKIPLSLRSDNLTITHAHEIASLPEKDKIYFCEEVKKEKFSVQELRQKIRNKKREDSLKDFQLKKLPDNLKIIHDDFRKVEFEKNSIDLILTDPPYPIEFIDLWKDLNIFADKYLKPSGFLIAYSGQINLPLVFEALKNDNFVYYWMMCLYHEGGTKLIRPRNLMNRWKPILVYQKKPYKVQDITFGDYFISEKREKSEHEWQQSESGVEKIIEFFSNPGDLICDPFSGGGTFPIVANRLDRRAIGIEIDETSYKLSLKRIYDAPSLLSRENDKV